MEIKYFFERALYKQLAIIRLRMELESPSVSIHTISSTYIMQSVHNKYGNIIWALIGPASYSSIVCSIFYNFVALCWSNNSSLIKIPTYFCKCLKNHKVQYQIDACLIKFFDTLIILTIFVSISQRIECTMTCQLIWTVKV